MTEADLELCLSTAIKLAREAGEVSFSPQFLQCTLKHVDQAVCALCIMKLSNMIIESDLVFFLQGNSK